MDAEERKTLLLVEDEAIIALAERRALERYGYAVRLAMSGEEAVALVGSSPDIDLILMDIDLGKGIDGTRTAELILAERELPVVFLSSHTEPEIVERTERITSFGYVVKNSSITVLDASIKMAFKLFDAKRRSAEAERKQNAMIANIADVIVIIDRDGINRYKSPNIGKWFGWSPDEVVGRSAFGNVHPDDLQAMLALFSRLAAAPGAAETGQCRYRCRDGGYKWIEITLVNLLDEPSVRGLLGNYHDITERKRAEDEKLFETLFAEKLLDSLPGIFYLYSYPELRLKRWNRNHEVVLGFGEGEIADRHISEWHPREAWEAVRAAVEVVMEKGYDNIESPLLAKDGSLVPFLMTGVRFEAAGERYLMGIGIDVRERRRAEQALRDSRETLDMILNTIPQAVFWKDREGRYLGCNRVFAQSAGRDDPAGIVGLTDYDLPWSREEADAYRADDQEVVSSNRPKPHIVERLDRADGTRIWIDTTKAPLRDRDGRPFAVLGVYEDITGRKLAEEERERRIGEMETLLREVHHRIKNNMASIEGMLSMQADTVASPEAQAALRDAIGRAASVRILYERLLVDEGFDSAPARPYVESLVSALVELFRGPVALRLELRVGDFELPPRKLFSLGIALNELVTNIMKYAFSGRAEGTLSVELDASEGRARLMVRDDGVGLPEGFDWRTAGTLGLMLVQMLARQLGGSFDLVSGGGTTAVLEFEL